MGRLNNEERSSLLHHASLLQQIATTMKGRQPFTRRPGQSSYSAAATLEQTVQFLLSLEAEHQSNDGAIYKRCG